MVFRDITEQRTLQDALRRSEERFAMAIAGSKDGIYDYNPVTREVWFSPRYKEILGYGDDEFPNDIAFWKGRMLPEDHAATTAQFYDYEAGRCDDVHIVQRFGNAAAALSDNGRRFGITTSINPVTVSPSSESGIVTDSVR